MPPLNNWNVIWVCESERFLLNPMMHATRGAKTLCGKITARRCPFIPLAHWGNPDSVDHMPDRMWCWECEKHVTKATGVAFDRTPESVFSTPARY